MKFLETIAGTTLLAASLGGCMKPQPLSEADAQRSYLDQQAARGKLWQRMEQCEKDNPDPRMMRGDIRDRLSRAVDVCAEVTTNKCGADKMLQPMMPGNVVFFPEDTGVSTCIDETYRQCLEAINACTSVAEIGH